MKGTPLCVVCSFLKVDGKFLPGWHGKENRSEDITYGVPSTTKFKFSNFVVKHAIVVFEHAIAIFN